MSAFYNKHVLITGGASGIGKIMARLSLERGAKVVLWDINPVSLEQTRTELSLLGEVKSYVVDVSFPEEIKRVASLVKSEVGDIDILINNAGIVVGKYFHEHTPTDITRMMNINASAPMYVALEFLPGMIDRNSGHICNIASSAGLTSNPKMSVYAASKWSVIGWSDSVRLEMKKLKKKVGVTTVTPYYINTGMFDGVKSLIPILKPEKAARRIIRGIELNRVFVSMPWNIHFIRICQGLLPVYFFDLVAGQLLGIYKTMDHFTGRK